MTALPWKLLSIVAVMIVRTASGEIINGSISGTCGFYQGTLQNVVYSQAFSGDGTFCTGFAPGGSFTDSGLLQGGDVYALAHNTISASAPLGYGVFVNFDTTLTVSQQYLLTPPVPSTTPTGSAKTFIAGLGTTDDGSGLGSCHEHVSLNIAGFSTPDGSAIFIPITFGQPISVKETATITCNDYAPVGFGFGDDGSQQIYAGQPFLLYDSNGNLLGPATLTTVSPEPATVVLLTSAFLLAAVTFARRNLRTL